MVVKDGFQRTDAGVVPEDWNVSRLGDLSQCSSGTTPSRALHERYFRGGVNAWVKTLDLNNGLIDSTSENVTATALKETSLQLYPIGTVLVAMYGGFQQIGRTGLLRVPATVNQALTAVRIHDRSLVPEYLLATLNYRVGYWRSVASSSRKDPNITGNDVRSFPIAYPREAEQANIAAALGDIDALLSGLDRLIAKKRDLKQAAMQQLLTGQTRLPGFQGEWETTTLKSAVVTPITDGPHLTPVFLPSGVPFLSVNNLIDNRLDFSGLRFISMEDHIEFSKKCKPRRGDILFGKAASVGMVALVETDMELNIWSPLALIRIAGKMHERFVFYALQAGSIGRQIKLLTNASSQGNIGMNDIGKLEIPVPSIGEQEAIAVFLSDMDAELVALEARRDKTRALKQGMMQELLTGRTRLVDAIPAAPVQAQVPTHERKANIHFLRAVLAAEIVDQLHQEPTFGHVKLEKMVFLAEHLCQVDTGSTYLRKAAGPLDPKALRSIDSQLRSQSWFEARKQEGRYTYVPLAKRGGHKAYFDRYYTPIAAKLSGIIETFRALSTERCEIVATLYAAWNDLLRDKGAASDDAIVHEVLNHWHESKQRISEDRWRKALDWMREKGFVPQGTALP